MAVNWSQPIDACPEGTTVCQAISQIWAITGNIDIPGGMVIARSSHGVSSYPYGAKEIVKIYGEELVARLNEKRIGADRYPLVKNFRGWAQPDMLTEQLETGKPYPIKAAWIQTTNTIGGQANDTRRHYNALKKLDFIVVVDLFHNPTTMALADIVLPAASFAEKQSIRSWWAPLSVVVKAVDVPECKSDWEINLELAKRLSLKPLPYDTVEDIINSRLKSTGLTYQKLAEKGSWEMPPEGPTKPYRRWERGLLRADGKVGFNTPTGKVELYSTFFEKCGIDPLPYYREPMESPVATPELYQKYPFILISGRRNPVYFHSELRQIPWLREIDPDPTVEIHPSKAKELSISEGEWVYLENDRGRVKAKARITPTIHPDCLSASHGWWLPETEGKEPNLFCTWDYNVNQLTKMGTQGSSGFGGSIFRCVLCKISKIA
jgi:anaerobic selenocysteine-containing dehydrogenase